MITAGLHRIWLYLHLHALHHTWYYIWHNICTLDHHTKFITSAWWLYCFNSYSGPILPPLDWKICFISWELGVSCVLSPNLVSGLCFSWHAASWGSFQNPRGYDPSTSIPCACVVFGSLWEVLIPDCLYHCGGPAIMKILHTNTHSLYIGIRVPLIIHTIIQTDTHVLALDFDYGLVARYAGVVPGVFWDLGKHGIFTHRSVKYKERNHPVSGFY